MRSYPSFRDGETRAGPDAQVIPLGPSRSGIGAVGEHRLAVVSTSHDMEWGMGNKKAWVARHKDLSGTDSALAG